jgi:hypothetical protein
VFRFRLLIGAALIGGVLIGRPIDPVMPHPALAAGNPVVWQLAKRAFNPSSGATDTISDTFTPTTDTYMVDVQMASSDASDEIYMQLGDDRTDITQIRSEEDRIFVVSHLQAGVVPAFRAIPDPDHDYGGRTIYYAVTVFRVPNLPLDADGMAVSQIANIFAFKAPTPGAYTVHYQIPSGSAHIIVVTAAGERDSGKVTGEGGFTVNLPVGLSVLGLKQVPGSGIMHWHLWVGSAPKAHDFSPANKATLRTAPTALSVGAVPGAKLVLDHQPVGGTVDAAGRVTYRPPQPLPAGLHLLQVQGADGTPATASATFTIAPPLETQTVATPAGSFGGVQWVRTSTPDGRYQLLKPASWRMAASAGTVVLSNPKGDATVLLSERFLGTSVDASAIAHQVGATLQKRLKLNKAWQYSGTRGKATFSGAVPAAGKLGPLASTNLVLPSLDHFSLLLAFGFGQQDAKGTMDGMLTRIENSITPNDDAAIDAARHYSRYDQGALSLDYPKGWAANFTTTGGTWFVSPADQAVLLAVGLDFPASKASSSAAQQFGRQLESVIQSGIHTKLRVVRESASGGTYRWVGVFPISGGTSVGVEIGQIAVGKGHLVGMWGDTLLERLPGNLPVLEHSLNSAALAAGTTPPTPLTARAVIRAIEQIVPADTSATNANGSSAGQSVTAPGKPGSAGYMSDYTSGNTRLQALQRIQQQQESYSFASSMSTMSYVSNMNSISTLGGSNWSYQYTNSYSSY